MRAYVLLFLVAAVVTYLLTVVAREFAMRTGAVAKVRDRDVHAVPIPYMGGVAMLGGLVAAYLVARELPFLADAPDFVLQDTGVVILAGALICVVGVVDDIFELDALTKLGGQVLATAILVGFNLQYTFITFPDGTQFAVDPAQGALLTGLVVITVVNAVNFIDGLDGLAAGVVGIGALAFFLFCYQFTRINDIGRASTAALLSVALAGACVGFLIHNWHPARLFMGDSGSMLIGLILAASAVTLSGSYSAGGLNVNAFDASTALLVTFLPLLLPLTILVVPLVDLVLAVVRRTRAGRSPFAADKKHLHHRLLEIGHSQRRAVLIMWMWAGLMSFGSVFVTLYRGPVVITGLAVATALIVLLTFVLPKIRGERTDKLLEAPEELTPLEHQPPA
ncbi:UDP-GlcNAc:undecaprenyl-phosphate GlcNAc-1-phosphate transferase [Nocardioides luteus]|uniref:Decaprenyl-phosphate N-acetylglucosaminephosphotransferase n=1 Tax=Nocardioides luteus TaxID=1844 RepID=A0ABQ5SWH5_9ACTN|nr:MraY family glycosyltransferase [Nocardioides luteus]MDR7311757.1 UDP-GlcNAc:undecaprenyl-phosphate GlcNAc-1-phosphate transferase [Nocardioides luteus]GGR66158.1 decaprenyl-phosphate N-acetylglucosaminephosphotransferase [Nocardioides luteus]GLJ67998.1 decaprenyl-phosphate N-acetylglucosaminephosphotransferase [Nocardioides luteus]